MLMESVNSSLFFSQQPKKESSCFQKSVISTRQIAKRGFENLKICHEDRTTKKLCCMSVCCCGKGVLSFAVAQTIPKLTTAAATGSCLLTMTFCLFGCVTCYIAQDRCEEVKEAKYSETA